jgi:hypothetical protein
MKYLAAAAIERRDETRFIPVQAQRYQSIVSAPAHLGLRKGRMPVVNPRIPQSEGWLNGVLHGLE